MSASFLGKEIKRYLKMQESYLYDIVKSRKNEEFQIFSDEILKKISPNIQNKILTLHISNISNIIRYKKYPKSGTYTLDFNEGSIFDKLPDKSVHKEKSIKAENNTSIFDKLPDKNIHKEEPKKNEENPTDYLMDNYTENHDNSCHLDKEYFENNNTNLDEDQEDTKIETQENEIKIDENIINNIINKISFSEEIIKFSSSKEINDTLIVNYEELKNSENLLDNIIKLLTKYDYCQQDSFSPICYENEWYIPLPDWAYSIKTHDLFSLTLAIILLIVILIISQPTNDNNTSNINSIDVKENLDNIFEQKKKIINELKEHEKIPDILFSEPFIDYISKQITECYYKKCYLTEKDKKEVFEFFHDQLIDLKEYISEYETSQGKLETLCEKITSYTSSEILYSYHFTFACLKHFLLNCSSYIYLTKILNEDLKKISNNNDLIKPYKDEGVSEIKRIIPSILNQFGFIDYYCFIDYGSSATGLDIKQSDRDILIFFATKYKSYSTDSLNLCEKVADLLKKEKLPYLTVHPREAKAIGQLIQLEYKKNGKEIKIDLTFTSDIYYKIYLEEMIKLVKSDLEKYPKLGPLTLIIKSILYDEGLNKVYDGGLNSSSVFFLARHIIISYEKENPSLVLLLYLFLDKYSKYDYTYGIDENGREFPYDQSLLPDERKRFIIKNPIIKYYFSYMNDNVASGCYETKEIISLFKRKLNYFFGDKEFCNDFEVLKLL